MQVALEKRNADTKPLTNNGYIGGVHWTRSELKDNGHGRKYYEFYCATCVYSTVYPDRLKQHLDADIHEFRLRKETEDTRYVLVDVSDGEEKKEEEDVSCSNL